MNNLNIQQKILSSALELVDRGMNRFTAEDLVVIAWEKYPEAFGLSGHLDAEGRPKYPNSNRVYAEIMGSKPIRKNGWLRKVGPKVYELTEAGLSQARMQSRPNETDEVRKWALDRQRIRFIERLHASRASRKFRDSKKEDISFFDACGFWTISARSNANDLHSKFADIESILSEAESSLLSQGKAQSRHGSNAYTVDDIKTLMDIHNSLKDKFKTEIDYIKARTDER